MTKRTLAVIPARGGSKGFPGKNIAELAGKPLIAWTIEASMGSQHVSRTVVSSDDPGILETARACGAEVIARPAELAADDTPSAPVVVHAIESLAEQGSEFDVVCLLQPTSPLRTAEDIDAAMQAFLASGAESLISVTSVDNKILKAFFLSNEGYLEPVSGVGQAFQRRQDLPETFLSNGAIYLCTIGSFLAEESFSCGQTVPFVMQGSKSIDIDTPNDLIAATHLMRDAQPDSFS